MYNNSKCVLDGWLEMQFFKLHTARCTFLTEEPSVEMHHSETVEAKTVIGDSLIQNNTPSVVRFLKY